jgi:hypothetical protein
MSLFKSLNTEKNIKKWYVKNMPEIALKKQVLNKFIESNEFELAKTLINVDKEKSIESEKFDFLTILRALYNFFFNNNYHFKNSENYTAFFKDIKNKDFVDFLLNELNYNININKTTNDTNSTKEDFFESLSFYIIGVCKYNNSLLDTQFFDKIKNNILNIKEESAVVKTNMDLFFETFRVELLNSIIYNNNEFDRSLRIGFLEKIKWFFENFLNKNEEDKFLKKLNTYIEQGLIKSQDLDFFNSIIERNILNKNLSEVNHLNSNKKVKI